MTDNETIFTGTTTPPATTSGTFTAIEGGAPVTKGVGDE